VNVLVVSHLYPYPGHERRLFVHEQNRALKERGVRLTVVSPTGMTPRPLQVSERLVRRGQTPKEAVLDGIPVWYPRAPILPRRLLLSRSGDLFFLAVRRRLERLRGQRFDLVHAHQALPDGACAQRLAAALGLPYVVTVHGRDVNYHLPHGGAVARRTSAALAGAAAVIGVSRAVTRRLAPYVAAEKLHTINNGVIGAGRQVPPADTLPGATLLLSVGNLIPSKGHHTVLEALAQLTQARSDLQYAIVGEGVERRALAAHARRLGIAELVHFLGYLPHERALGVMARADLFVLPSSPEGFGLVYVEAMSQSTPVIACEGEGPEDFIRHGENGYLVPRGDAATLARVVAEALADDERRARLGAAGRATVTDLTWSRNAELTERLYAQIAPRPGANSAKGAM